MSEEFTPINPGHYRTGKFECIEVMEEALGTEAVKNFCICNAFKYLYRHKNKNGDEDIKKAKWYLDHYISITEKISLNDAEKKYCESDETAVKDVFDSFKKLSGFKAENVLFDEWVTDKKDEFDADLAKEAYNTPLGDSKACTDDGYKNPFVFNIGDLVEPVKDSTKRIWGTCGLITKYDECDKRAFVSFLDHGYQRGAYFAEFELRHLDDLPNDIYDNLLSRFNIGDTVLPRLEKDKEEYGAIGTVVGIYYGRIMPLKINFSKGEYVNKIVWCKPYEVDPVIV